MNKDKVLKELTKEGCIIGEKAAEELDQTDLEQIKNLDSPPMYITKEMLQNLRNKNSKNKEDSEKTKENYIKQEQSSGSSSQKQILKQKEEESSETKDQQRETPESKDKINGEEKEGEKFLTKQETEDDKLQKEFEERGSKFSEERTVKIKDDRNKTSLDTKVEVKDPANVSRNEKDVPEFLQYYNDRYEKMQDLLKRRMELKSATTINRLNNKKEGDEATTIGLVKQKYSTSNGKFIVSLEDKTGQYKALVDSREGQRIVPDEVIGVNGSLGGDIIYADNVIRPDLPIPQGELNSTKQEAKAAYISDFHIGSKDTLNKRLERFAKWLGSKDAEKIGYLVIPGDVVEGVGNYPGQENDLEITDIYKQYEKFEQWVEKVPENIQIIITPGNHDITRLAEPQPRIPEKAVPKISDFNNVHLVQNPARVRLHGIRSKGIKHLLYHGYSFDEQIDMIKDLREKAYDEPHHVMIDLLKRRHLAPTYGSNLLSPEDKDHLVIEQRPDVFVAGHLHSHANHSYKGVNVIASSTFQSQTEYQKRVGHQPDPGKVTIMNFKTRETRVRQF